MQILLASNSSRLCLHLSDRYCGFSTVGGVWRSCDEVFSLCNRPENYRDSESALATTMSRNILTEPNPFVQPFAPPSAVPLQSLRAGICCISMHRVVLRTGFSVSAGRATGTGAIVRACIYGRDHRCRTTDRAAERLPRYSPACKRCRHRAGRTPATGRRRATAGP